MKRLTILLLSLFVVLGLAACGETEDKPIDSVETSDDSNDSKDVAKAETEGAEDTSYDEVLLDDDVALVTLKGIETVRDDVFGDEHKIKLLIENKSDKTIIVQADQVSIDGFMVDDMVFFSETVAGEKKANGNLDIIALDEELPDLNENLEFILVVIDEESFERISETDISVNIK